MENGRTNNPCLCQQLMSQVVQISYDAGRSAKSSDRLLCDWSTVCQRLPDLLSQ